MFVLGYTEPLLQSWMGTKFPQVIEILFNSWEKIWKRVHSTPASESLFSLPKWNAVLDNLSSWSPPANMK